MRMSEKLPHTRWPQPPGSSCDENTHISAADRPKPASLLQFFEQAVVDKFSRLRILCLSAGSPFKNFVDAFRADVWNPIAAVTHTVSLMQLRQSFRINDLGIFLEDLHAEGSIGAEAIQSLSEAAQKPQRRITLGFDEASGRGQRGIGKNNPQLTHIDELVHSGFDGAEVTRRREDNGIQAAGTESSQAFRHAASLNHD